MQEALDGIEFARGDPDSKWGSLRAAMGHPKPFDLRYVAVGNEDCSKKNYRGLHIRVESYAFFTYFMVVIWLVRTDCWRWFKKRKISSMFVSKSCYLIENTRAHNSLYFVDRIVPYIWWQVRSLGCFYFHGGKLPPIMNISINNI